MKHRATGVLALVFAFLLFNGCGGGLECANDGGGGGDQNPTPAANSVFVTDRSTGRLIGLNDFDGANWRSAASQFGDRALKRIEDIAVDSAGRIYMADSGNNRIVRIDNLSGAGLVTYDTPSPPGDVWVDAQNRIYFVERTRVSRIDDLTGANLVQRFVPELEEIFTVAVDPQSRIVLGGETRPQVFRPVGKIVRIN